MAEKRTAIQKTKAFILKLFPERQIYFRTNGVVRFTTISTRLQVILALFLLAGLGWFATTSLYFLQEDERLLARDQQIETLQNAYADASKTAEIIAEDLSARAEAIEARQQFLESVLAENTDIPIDSVTEETAPENNNQDIAAPTDKEASVTEQILQFANMDSDERTLVALPETDILLSLLSALEARQAEQARLLTILAENQLADINARIADTGLSAEKLLAMASKTTSKAQGGPFIPLTRTLSETTEWRIGDHGVEEAFEELIAQWGEVYRVMNALSSMPSVTPPAEYYVSSRFGRRRDPIEGIPAMHYGIDMAGWPGTDVYSAQSGKVLRAGVNGAYGNFVEIDHGNGFKSRYGHMRRISVKVGEHIGAGAKIGEMGCSGRCTSTHLHFEVWFNDSPINPLPFIEVSDDVREIQRRFSLSTYESE